jgi:hypothetical protein
MSYACPVKFFAEDERSEFNWGTMFTPPAQLNFYTAYRFKPQDVYQEWHPMIIPLV